MDRRVIDALDVRAEHEVALAQPDGGEAALEQRVRAHLKLIVETIGEG